MAVSEAASNGKFLWGVAASAFQHEGGYNMPGGPLNNWQRWEEDGHVEPSGASIDFWNRYEADFDLAASLGLNAFRFGFEWARVQPAFVAGRGVAPCFDEAALARYGAMAVAARRRGLEPVVTLHHFTHPAWLGMDAWLSARTPALFAEFAVRAVEAANLALEGEGREPLRWFITVNEPNMLVLNSYSGRNFPATAARTPDNASHACCRLLEAHVRASRAIHALYARHPSWGRPMLAINTYTSDVYWNDKLLLDLLAAPAHTPRHRVGEWLRERERAFNETVRRSGLPRHHSWRFWAAAAFKRLYSGAARLAVRLKSLEPLLDLLYEHPGEIPLDFLAMDYYDPFVAHMIRLPRISEIWDRRHPYPDWLLYHWTSKWWDWVALPEGLGLFARQLHADFPRLPIVIAENGMAYRKRRHFELPWRRDRLQRSQFLRLHLAEVEVLRGDGIPVSGYFHWSLTDNYEWGSYAPRFGLFHINFQGDTRERIAVDELGDNPSRTYAEWVRSRGVCPGEEPETGQPVGTAGKVGDFGP